jgi:hypothetical protein
LPQGKTARQRHKHLVNKLRDKPTPSRTIIRLQSYLTPLQEKLTKKQLLKDRRKKNTTHRPTTCKTKTELLLKYQHQDWIIEE